MKKYELIKESKTMFAEREIFRIRALKDFEDVKAGDVGGWVCSYNNLSQEGECWIYDEAKCLDEARVYDNAVMCGNAVMFGNAKMFDNAKMCGSSKMFDNAEMCDSSIMFDNAVMCDNAEMCGRATLDKDKLLYGSINRSYKKIFQCPCEKRFLIAILTEENEILYSVGSQIGITKEKLINIIYNYCRVIDKELEEYPCRQEYLKIIDMAENYLREFI